MAAEYGRDVEWLVALPERLQVARARREFEAAVRELLRLRALLEERPVLRRALESTAVRAAVERERDAVVRLLVRDAQRVCGAAAAQKRDAVRLLDDLGMGAAAQDAVLGAWAARLGRCAVATTAAGGALDGDVVGEVGAASGWFFAVLGDAVEEGLALFGSGCAASRLADWASAQIAAFCQRLVQRVLLSEARATVAACAQLLVHHCSTLLPPGFDLSFVVQQHMARAQQANTAAACPC